MKTRTLFIIMAFLMMTPTFSQNQPEKVTNSMEPLFFMMGKWEGTGWTMTREGKSNSNIKEHVYCKTDCNILVAEGLGTKTNPETNETIVVHEAFGVMFKDPETGKFTLRAYKDNNISISEVEIIDEKIIRWKLELPNQGTVRFTSDYSQKDKWIEIGEFSRDGENWMQFLGMDLTRVAE